MIPYRILCVDDENRNLKLLESMLVYKGYEVVLAQDSETAIRFLHNQRIDLILLDVLLPGINGYELCRHLKTDEAFRDIPIILVTSLSETQERILGIEAGADDFITKPFDRAEILARIGMLLEVKMLNERMRDTYRQISRFTEFGEKAMSQFLPGDFDLKEHLESYIIDMIRKPDERVNRPEVILVGFVQVNHGWEWNVFRYDHGIRKSPISGEFDIDGRKSERRVEYHILNAEKLNTEPYQYLIKELAAVCDVQNLAVFSTDEMVVYCLNYNEIITTHEAILFHNLIMQSLFLQSIAEQTRHITEGFEYAVLCLARATEANDHDTGNHILRVGEYAYLLATQMGLPVEFRRNIRIQALLHDVGKLHISAEILRKPGPLTSEEFLEMKEHCLLGSKIIGDHPRLEMAAAIARTHHEKWDGSGYPKGLKGHEIPIEGRITALADQYDAIRNKRSYKESFSHEETCRTILYGDGRTLPEHFDSDVLEAFRAISDAFDRVYEIMRDDCGQNEELIWKRRQSNG